MRRPYLRSFLVFVLKYFRQVLVWSAGKYHYVHDVVKDIFTGLPSPTVIYTRVDMPPGPSRKPISHILADKLLKDCNCTLANTYIIDDRLDYFALDPSNGIHIPPYSPSPTPTSLRMNDVTLLQLQWWLSIPAVKNAKDIRTIGGIVSKDYIFRQPITYWEKLSNEQYDTKVEDNITLINSNPTIKTTNNDNINYNLLNMAY